VDPLSERWSGHGWFAHGRTPWSLLASGQITMRTVDGWPTLAEPPSDHAIDLAA
jgi:hypothetical protein